ncbi:MAG: DUF5989 family protein [Candidatus Acidiferrum sp.]
MSERGEEALQSLAVGGAPGFVWQRRLWWLLPLAVLMGLVGIIYVLGHMSSADPEMYPTTLKNNTSYSRVC